MPGIDRSYPKIASTRGELSVGGRSVHASAYPDAASFANADSKALAKERKKLLDSYGRSHLSEQGHIPSQALEKMTDAQHRELMQRFPLTMTASVARWQSDFFDN